MNDFASLDVRPEVADAQRARAAERGYLWQREREPIGGDGHGPGRW